MDQLINVYLTGNKAKEEMLRSYRSDESAVSIFPED